MYFSNQISKSREFFDLGRKFRYFALAFELCDAGDLGGICDLERRWSYWSGASWGDI